MEVEEVKCVNSVMDEVIPDGIGSSDSDDGEILMLREIHACILYVKCQFWYT